MDEDLGSESKEKSTLDAMNLEMAKILSPEGAKQDAFSRLGLEARSILKSIETETVKLKQYEFLSRTDRHYFRARFNYYKLSILRLRQEERDFIEPKLIEFHQDIAQREFESGGDPSEVTHAPFLHAVKKGEPVPGLIEPSGLASTSLRSEPPRMTWKAEASVAPSSDSEFAQALIGELSMVRLALQASPSHDNNRIIGEAIDRAMSRVRAKYSKSPA